MTKLEWPNNTIHISANFEKDTTSVEACNLLKEPIKKALVSCGFDTLFPVQHTVLLQYVPHRTSNFLEYNIDTPDLCVCAPTGSGKTLAYLLPILNSLEGRKVCRTRALIVVPGRELAMQVQSVVEPLCKALNLKVSLAIGQTSMSTEAKRLFSDILIATPGRLLDHVENTIGFTLQHVEWLVFDEADRLLEGFTRDWLPVLFKSLDKSGPDSAGNISWRTAEATPWDCPLWTIPLKKILVSATLTKNPAKLAELDLYKPVYLAVAGSTDKEEVDSCSPSTTTTTPSSSKYNLPKELSEFMFVGEEERKPVALVYLVRSIGLTRSLCFTKSVDSTEKLLILLRRVLSEKRIASFSSSLTPAARSEMLAAFNNGDIDMLICSDAAARGLDLNKVQAVVNYDVPKYMKTYVHRVGRTARAGTPGTAYTLLAIREAHYFKEMILKGTGRERMPPLRIPKHELQSIVPAVAAALLQPTKDL